MEQRFNGLSIVALALMGLAAFSILSDRNQSASTVVAAPLTVENTTPISLEVNQNPEPTPEERHTEPEDIRLPYDAYVLTQGPHGFSYGDAAIDLTGGEGEAILSPISGIVTKNGFDEWGNTALVIENERWEVRLLHGDYFPPEGETIDLGQVIGAESNHGYTIDWQGRSCAGRDCGYHTHMNVYDKLAGQNANLIELLQP